MQSYQSTPSPTKTAFRSKTKIRQAVDSKYMNSTQRKTQFSQTPFKSKNQGFEGGKSFGLFLKQFPLEVGQEVFKILRTIQPVHEQFLSNLQNLRLYKNQLASQFQKNWGLVLDAIKIVVNKLIKRGDRLTHQNNKKIQQLLMLNRSLQSKQQSWKQKIQNIQHLRQMQKAQLGIAQTQLQIVNFQMREIYKTLQGDLEKAGKYLAGLQQARSDLQNQGTNQITDSLKSLSVVITGFQQQQKRSGSNLQSMRQLIKAMAACTKVSTSVQVDQTQLITSAKAVFQSSKKQKQQIKPPLIDVLKDIQKKIQTQKFRSQKHAEKPWGLTPILILFLQNMSKQKQGAKILPWQHTRQIMNNFLSQRIKLHDQISVSQMMMDECLVIYFINKYKLRRLAQLKLLQLIVSLKYYSRYWPKAQLFCQLLGIIKYRPISDNSDYSYVLDFNSQSYFLTIYKKMISLKTYEDEGAIYVSSKQVKKIVKSSLYFTDQVNRSRILSRLDKDHKIFNQQQCCDFDFTIILTLDQYMLVKKKISTNLTREFSKKYQQNRGYFSIDQIKDLFLEQAYLYRIADGLPNNFPLLSQLNLGKLYLDSFILGHNNYQLNMTYFIQTIKKQGFDAPFPFIHACFKNKKNTLSQQDSYGSNELTINNLNSYQKSQQNNKKQIANKTKIQTQINVQKNEKPQVNSYQPIKQRVQIGVKLFGQHFSILRQLRQYVQIFSTTLKNQKNPQILWKNFNQIQLILQKGCQFLRYPLVDAKSK